MVWSAGDDVFACRAVISRRNHDCVDTSHAVATPWHAWAMDQTCRRQRAPEPAHPSMCTLSVVLNDYGSWSAYYLR